MVSNKMKLAITIIVIFAFCLAVGLTKYIQDRSFVEISPIKASVNIKCGEVLSLDKIYIGKKEIVSKEDVNKYITSETYKNYLDNKFYFKHDMKNRDDLMLKDIMNLNRN